MSLTIKDLVTTVLAVLTAGVWWVQYKGLDYPVISNVRWALVVLLVIGVVMCAVGGATGGKMTGDLMVMLAAGLGILSLVLLVLGLIFGTSLWLNLTVAAILLAWLVTTFRHLVTK